MFEARIERAKILVEALPFIQKFRGQLLVVKYGGSVMTEDRLKASVASDIVLLKCVGIHPVVVHGGGNEISTWMKRIGKEPRFVEGLRFTDDETMELTEMVLSGKTNKEIVTCINQAGGKAIGLSGKDAGLFSARQIRSKNNEDLGLVGEIDRTDTGLLHDLTIGGYIPVISSVSADERGKTLNLNADYVAAGLAVALKALKLIYLTDVMGILRNGELLNNLTLAEAYELLKHPDIKGGMIPKLECSVRAIEGGTSHIHMINGTLEHSLLLEILTSGGIGTMISKSGESN